MNADDRRGVLVMMAESLERMSRDTSPPDQKLYRAYLDSEAFRLRALAEPEKPAEPLTLASPDRAFKMQVWVKPNRLEAQILEQPEEWRMRVPVMTSLGGNLRVVSASLPCFGDETLWIRGGGRSNDSTIFARVFDSDSARDAYLTKVEAAVAAMPRAEPEFQVGQWVEHSFRRPEKGRVVNISLVGRTLDIEVLGGEQFCDSQDEFKPCPPVCTAEQMSILPGDTVRVDDVPVDAQGLPYDSDFVVRTGEIIEVHGRWNVGLQTSWGTKILSRWNIASIVERGPNGPGGKP